MFLNKDCENKLCYIDIQSGSGGMESKDWINILTRMYIKWANIKKLKVSIVSNYSINSNKNKNVLLKIFGNYAYLLFKTETGIHKLIRKSPFDSWKRHTTFGSVYVYKELNIISDTIINYKDIKIDYYKSSGSGGQHVNKTESAVRIKHLPTGIITQCQNNRSQHKNKNQAINQLRNKLNNLKIKNNVFDKKKIYLSKSSISWGNHIRTYILDNSLIKDVRTGIKVKNVKDVLNGNLEIFIKNLKNKNILNY